MSTDEGSQELQLVVDLVSLRALPGLGLGVLGRMRLARALAARGRMVLEARIRAPVVGIRPLSLVRIAHRVVERVVRLGVLRAVPRAERLAFLVPHWSGAAAEMSAS